MLMSRLFKIHFPQRVLNIIEQLACSKTMEKVDLTVDSASTSTNDGA